MNLPRSEHHEHAEGDVLGSIGQLIIGRGDDVGLRRRVAEALPVPLAPRICEIGQMQRPSLLASADGERPWSGFISTIDIE